MRKRKLFGNGGAEDRVELGIEVRDLPLEVRRLSERAEDDGESEEPLELEFAFASETPVERFFGEEILEVTPEAARLERVAQGVVPVLANHNSDEQIGRVLGVTIGSDRIARARVRFSRGAAARDVVRDVVDGIRQGVSFGYRVHKMELLESGDDGDRFRVSDWELYELTIAAMPADPTIGVHRAADDSFETLVSRKVEKMKVRALHRASGAIVEVEETEIDGVEYIRALESTPHPPAVVDEPAPKVPSADSIRAAERARINDIEELGATFNASEDAIRTAVADGSDVEAFVQTIRLERAASGDPLEKPPTDLDLSNREREAFSINNAVRVMLDRQSGRGTGESSLELEASDEIAKRLDRRPQGFFVPYDVLNRSAWDGEIEGRAATTTSNAGGLVATDLMAGGFIDLLRNRTIIGRLGATIIPGLVGNVDFPRQTSDPDVAWVLEGLGGGDGTIAADTVSLTPKTIRSRVDLTRRMLLQSTPAIEQITRNSLGMALARGIDLAAMAGAGGAAEPEGILNMSGAGAGTWVGTNGTTMFQSVVELETLVAAANADAGALGYATTPEVRGTLKGTFRDAGSGVRIWEGTRDAGELNGYQAEVTNALPKNLGGGTNEHAMLAGYWPGLYVGEWGVLDLMPDTSTLGDSGGLVLRAFQDVDVAADHEERFAVVSFVP